MTSLQRLACACIIIFCAALPVRAADQPLPPGARYQIALALYSTPKISRTVNDWSTRLDRERLTFAVKQLRAAQTDLERDAGGIALIGAISEIVTPYWDARDVMARQSDALHAAVQSPGGLEAITLYNKQKEDEALAALAAIARDAEGPLTLRHVAWLAIFPYAEGYFPPEKMKALLREVVAENPGATLCAIMLMEFAIHDGDGEQVLKQLDFVLTHAGSAADRLEAMLALGETLARHNGYDLAANVWTEALAQADAVLADQPSLRRVERLRLVIARRLAHLAEITQNTDTLQPASSTYLEAALNLHKKDDDNMFSVYDLAQAYAFRGKALFGNDQAQDALPLLGEATELYLRVLRDRPYLFWGWVNHAKSGLITARTFDALKRREEALVWVDEVSKIAEPLTSPDAIIAEPYNVLAEAQMLKAQLLSGHAGLETVLEALDRSITAQTTLVAMRPSVWLNRVLLSGAYLFKAELLERNTDYEGALAALAGADQVNPSLMADLPDHDGAKAAQADIEAYRAELLEKSKHAQ